LPGTASSPNARCGYCLGFREDPQHGAGPQAPRGSVAPVSIRVLPVAIACPVCDAKPGKPCVDRRTRRVLATMHRSRHKAAQVETHQRREVP
jgi:hypothetical protein